MVLVAFIVSAIQIKQAPLELPFDIGRMVMRDYITYQINSRFTKYKGMDVLEARYIVSGISFKKAHDLLAKPLLAHGWKEEGSLAWAIDARLFDFTSPRGEQYFLMQAAGNADLEFSLRMPLTLLKQKT